MSKEVTSDKPFKHNIGSAGSSVRGERMWRNQAGLTGYYADATDSGRKQTNPGHQSDYKQKVTKKTKVLSGQSDNLSCFGLLLFLLSESSA